MGMLFVEMATSPRRVENLDINPAEDGFIIYQPELDRVHFLNPTAVLILELCDGSRSVAEIQGLVQEAYGLPEAPVQAVDEALEKMKNEGLLL
jgi:hypothetical protein